MCGLKMEKNVRILMGTVVYCPWKIIIGDNTVINEAVVLDGRGGIKIGKNVSISMRTLIITGSHDVNSDSFKYISAPVIIEDNVWTGSGSIILPGTTLERKSVLAAGSVAKSGNYEAEWIYSGVPAVKIKRRIVDEYKLGYWKPWLR